MKWLINSFKESGIDVTPYVEAGYNYDQVQIIGLGLTRGLNVELFAKPDFDYNKMSWIYCSLRDGYPIEPYCKEFSGNQLSVLHAGFTYGVDVESFAKPDLTPRQMQEALLTQLTSAEHVHYLEEGFSIPQIQMIHEGDACGVDSSVYAKPDLTPSQMRVVLDGLKEGLDMGSINDLDVNVDILYTYIEALRKGIDVSKYNIFDSSSPDYEILLRVTF